MEHSVRLILSVYLCGHLVNLASSASNACIKVPFAPRRCYEYVTGGTNWEQASADCQSRGQRLAVIEDEQLLQFVDNTFPFSSNRATTVWVGLRRQANGQPDLWVNGAALDKSAYPTKEPRVGRTVDTDQLCTRLWKDGGLDDAQCHDTMTRFCETYRGPTFKLRKQGYVLANTAAGREVTSDTAMTLMGCARKCDEIYDTCNAFGYKDGRCWLHDLQNGQNFPVGVDEIYERIEI